MTTNRSSLYLIFLSLRIIGLKVIFLFFLNVYFILKECGFCNRHCFIVFQISLGMGSLKESTDARLCMCVCTEKTKLL